MTNSSIRENFNYNNLDRETADFIRQQTGEIRSLIRKTAQDIINVGHKLIEVKSNLEHGYFLSWLESEFAWTERTAQQFMNVARRFKYENFSDLQLAPSALYLLAAPSMPELAFREALNLARQGQVITWKKAKAIRQKYVSPLIPQSQISDPAVQQSLKPPEREQATALISDKTLPVHSQTQTLGSKVLLIKSKQMTLSSKLSADSSTPCSLPANPIERGMFWSLGNRHLIYCGNPVSPKFRDILPQQVALALLFPPNSENWLSTPMYKAVSSLSWQTSYSDQDYRTLCQGVEQFLLLATNADDSVVVAFLPDPKLLLLVHKLGCRCYVVEPNPSRCETAIATWRKMGGVAAPVSSLSRSQIL